MEEAAPVSDGEQNAAGRRRRAAARSVRNYSEVEADTDFLMTVLDESSPEARPFSLAFDLKVPRSRPLAADSPPKVPSPPRPLAAPRLDYCCFCSLARVLLNFAAWLSSLVPSTAPAISEGEGRQEAPSGAQGGGGGGGLAGRHSCSEEEARCARAPRSPLPAAVHPARYPARYPERYPARYPELYLQAMRGLFPRAWRNRRRAALTAAAPRSLPRPPAQGQVSGGTRQDRSQCAPAALAHSAPKVQRCAHCRSLEPEARAVSEVRVPLPLQS